MTDVPAITVIVPTYGRPGIAARLVRALQAQHLPGSESFEVIVVDDGSPVRVEVAAAGGDGPAVQVLRQQRQGPAAARNAGLEAARGELVAFIDDDCEPAPGWLAALRDGARRHPGCGLGGHVVNQLRHNPFAEASQLIVTYLCDYYRDASTWRFFTSNNLAFPRAGLQARGGFDAAYTRAAGEDRELCDRWVALGGRLMAVPDAVVLHAHPLSWRTFLRQHYEYGRGAWGYRCARAARAGAPVRVEPWSFYRNLLMYPIRVHGWRGAWLTALVGLAQTANAVGFLVEAVRSRLA